MRSLKVVGSLIMILLGGWTVGAMSTKSIYGSPLNMAIALLGCGLMVFISYLESRGEV